MIIVPGARSKMEQVKEVGLSSFSNEEGKNNGNQTSLLFAKKVCPVPKPILRKANPVNILHQANQALFFFRGA